MAVDSGDILTVKYVDEQTFSGSQTEIETTLTAAAAGTLLACATTWPSPGCLHWSYVDEGITVYMGLPGENFTVEVSDIDLALEVDVARVSAYVFPTDNADFEMLDLTLSDASTFRGILRSELAGSGSPEDGVLSLTGDTEVIFTYTDEVPRVTKTAKIRIASPGVIEAGPRLLNGLPAFAVNLTDRDLNRQQSVREVVTVEIVNARFPDQIARIGLLESAPSSGLFQGSITLTQASTPEPVNDGTLRGLSGDMLTISYADALPAAIISSSLPLRFAGGIQTSTHVAGGNEIFLVTLFDGDLGTDLTRPDQLDAILTVSSDSQGQIPVSMTETAVDNGIFTASILPRIVGTDIDIDAVDPFGHAIQIEVARGLVATLLYVDADNGIPLTESVTVFTMPQIDISVFFESNDGVLQVTLSDADLVDSNAPLSAQVFTSDSSQSIEVVALKATGVGSAIFTGNILAQAHTGVTVPGRISLTDSGTISARFHDQFPEAAVAVEVSSPRPRFIEPTPANGTRFTTAVDCAVQIGLRGADRSIESQRLKGASVLVKATKYRDRDGTYKAGLLPGVSLSPAEPGTSFETSMSWTPRRTQEGGLYIMCFEVKETHDLVSTEGESERCFDFLVTQCRKCALAGENLNHLASFLGSEWLNIWSLNPGIKNPHEILDGYMVNTSLVYRVAPGDSMASISMRFGTSVKFLLAINTDLAFAEGLEPNSTICVLPNQIALDRCPAPARSTTWEKLEEQYVPVDYYDNPFNWEDIQWTDEGGKPVKAPNPDYPQLPARMVAGKETGYSLPNL